MKNIHVMAVVAALLTIPITSASASTVCQKSADRMFQSCSAEITEEYKATIASCINFSDANDRADCNAEASEGKQENAEGCHDQRKARRDVCDLLGEDRYDPDPLTGESLDGDTIFFVDPEDIGGTEMPNPYFSLVPGTTQVLRAGVPGDWEETIVVHVSDEIREIEGVGCRVVVDIVLLTEKDEEDASVDYEAIEVTDDYYAQSTDRDVYYCGEIARNFEDGALVDLDGSFEAGRDFAKAGILIKAAPTVGDAHRQEWLLGEAEDVIQYVDTAAIPGADEGGQNPNSNGAFECDGIAGSCIKTEEFIPPEPESGEFKYFKAGIGFVLGVALEDGEITGERDELVCVGDSLAVLADPACGIEDPEELLEVLCELSPKGFCEDD